MQVQLPDFTMAYEISGEGRPLVFIHGYPLNRTLWDSQVSGLSDVAHVLAPDLRGHGESTATSGTYTMDLLADDVNNFLDAVGITQPIILCGLSMGGYVTFAFYRKYKSRLAGLILAATRAGADSDEAKANRQKAAATAREQGASAIASSMLPKMLAPKTYESKPDLVVHARGMMESTSVDGMVGDLLGMKDRPDSTLTLAEIDLPTLILHGADDQLIPATEAQAMHTAIKNSKLHLLPDAGHLISLEQPVLFNEAVRGFMGTS